jgi:hypothetical protein
MVDGSIAVQLVTPEISGSKAGELFDLRKKIAYCYISPRTIESNEIKMVNALDPELKGKTPGQRLRAVLFRAWEQSPEGYKDSESYYMAKMESFINGVKAELV